MSEKKINPGFIILSVIGLLIVGFGLLGTVAAGAEVDEPDANRDEVWLQLSTLLNFILAGSAVILAGIGFQLTAGPKAPQAALPLQSPAYPYGQAAQPQYQSQQQQPQGGQQWGQQSPGQPPG